MDIMTELANIQAKLDELCETLREIRALEEKRDAINATLARMRAGILNVREEFDE